MISREDGLVVQTGSRPNDIVIGLNGGTNTITVSGGIGVTVTHDYGELPASSYSASYHLFIGYTPGAHKINM